MSPESLEIPQNSHHEEPTSIQPLTIANANSHIAIKSNVDLQTMCELHNGEEVFTALVSEVFGKVVDNHDEEPRPTTIRFQIESPIFHPDNDDVVVDEGERYNEEESVFDLLTVLPAANPQQHLDLAPGKYVVQHCYMSALYVFLISFIFRCNSSRIYGESSFSNGT